MGRIRYIGSFAADAVPITVELAGISRVTTMDGSRTGCANRGAVRVVDGGRRRRSWCGSRCGLSFRVLREHHEKASDTNLGGIAEDGETSEHPVHT